MGNYTSLVWKSSDVAPAPTNIGTAYEGQDVSGSSIVITETSVIETAGSGIGPTVDEEKVIAEMGADKKEEVVENKDLVKDSAVLNPSPHQSPKMNKKRKNKKGKHQ